MRGKARGRKLTRRGLVQVMTDSGIAAMPMLRQPRVIMASPVRAVAAGGLGGLLLLDVLGDIHAANFTRARKAKQGGKCFPPC